MVFRFYRLRFRFRAEQPVRFPGAGAANTLRGGLGLAFRHLVCRPDCPGARICENRDTCAYARIFEPRAGGGAGPSGLADRPRPFVLRARHLDGQVAEAGAAFWFDVHLFTPSNPPVAEFAHSFAALGRDGLGRGRGRAELASVADLDLAGSARGILYDASSSGVAPPAAPLEVDLGASGRAAWARVRFLAPTELKSGGGAHPAPAFPILFARLRDRLSTLAALYDNGALPIDFGALGRRAAAVRMTRCELAPVSVVRRSTRTGQVHPLGGFVGAAEYEGELGEFLPYLAAGQWTGVGRQTVWGKGEIAVESAAARPILLQPGAMPPVGR